MPSTVRLRYVGAQTAAVPALGREVEPDSLVEFPGVHLDVDEDADHYLIESGNPPQPRAWPKSQWRNETVAAPKKVKE